MDAFLATLLRQAVQCGASDVHLCVEQPPVFRLNGKLQRQGEATIGVDQMERLAEQLVPEAKRAEWAQGETDFSISISGVGRFRVNAYRSRGSAAIAVRAIPFTVQNLNELGLPAVVATLSRRSQGLVLVTGPTGSGKSTTLAAMIDLINEERHCHIVTLEDPIEYLHRHKKAVINQREIGTDTASFARGLRAALREDPDVILIGEMRDLATMEMGLQAAETGHLVLATLHTNDAPATVERIINAFPEGQQEQVRVQLAGVLEGIIAQQLLPRVDRPGRVAAHEILVVTPAVRNLIREAKTHQLRSVIQTGGKLGMRTMAAAVKSLYEAGTVAWDDYAPYVDQEGPGVQVAAGRDPLGRSDPLSSRRT